MAILASKVQLGIDAKMMQAEALIDQKLADGVRIIYPVDCGCPRESLDTLRAKYGHAGWRIKEQVVAYRGMFWEFEIK